MERISIDQIITCRLYLGPMSRNIIDAVISIANKYKVPIGLIASRRQIDHNGGYVGFCTETFVDYVRSKSQYIILCRDHGGPGQGDIDDNGVDSLLVDSKLMDVVHVDPFKLENIKNSEDAIDKTKSLMDVCFDGGCLFEVGTEEVICPISPAELDVFLQKIKKSSPSLFNRIIYAVVQSGTALKDGKNIGDYKFEKLKAFVDICSSYGLLSKEHNGDYVNAGDISNKFSYGLSAVNIAPEVAGIESGCILAVADKKQIDDWFILCLHDGRWKKWFEKGFVPELNKEKLVHVCGHYVFNKPEFRDIFKNNDVIYEDLVIKLAKFIKGRI